MAIKEKNTSVEILIKSTLKKFSVKEAYIFGSYLYNKKYCNDIDIAVSLKKEKDFFKLYRELTKKIEKNVDLIYLENETKFNSIIKRDGLKIYG